MKSNDYPLFGGISGVEMPVDEYDFGSGVILRRTYCHVFGPLMAAFSLPPIPNEHHPGPWKAVGGGEAHDVLAELRIPLDFNLGEWFDSGSVENPSEHKK